MTRDTTRFSAALTTALLLVGLPALADTDKPDAVAASASAAHTEEALRLLKRSSDYLAAQNAFRFSLEEGFDAVQSTGLTLEFGAVRDVTVKRPDRVRVAENRRDGRRSVLFFDGRTISLWFPTEMAWTAVEKPGTLEAAIDHLIDDLGAKAPLSDLLRHDFYAHIVHRLEAGLVVGKSRIAGRRCDHLAFTSADIDAQIWLESGDRPVPWRVVLTYKTAPGRPQFRAQFSAWDLDPDVADPVFHFSPPVDSEHLPIETAADTRKDQ